MMTAQEITKLSGEIIKEEIKVDGINVVQIVLFGSRACGNNRIDSDWDFLVSVDQDISFAKKAGISARILTRLAEIGIDADLVIKTEGRIRQEQDNVGSITHYAMKYGVEV